MYCTGTVRTASNRPQLVLPLQLLQNQILKFLREALIPIREPWIPNVRCPSVRPGGKKVIFAKGTSVSEWVRSASVKIQNRVREKRDFCEGYKRLGQGQIRLDNFSEVKSGY